MIQMSGGREMSCCLFLDGTAEMMYISYDSSFFSGEHAGKVFIVGSTDFRRMLNKLWRYYQQRE